jgi:hypothetical protein
VAAESAALNLSSNGPGLYSSCGHSLRGRQHRPDCHLQSHLSKHAERDRHTCL